MDIPDIKAQNLDQDVVIIVQMNGQKIIELNCNAFSYAYAMATSSNPD